MRGMGGGGRWLTGRSESGPAVETGGVGQVLQMRVVLSDRATASVEYSVMSVPRRKHVDQRGCKGEDPNEMRCQGYQID